jgi:hypothetical protein
LGSAAKACESLSSFFLQREQISNRNPGLRGARIDAEQLLSQKGQLHVALKVPKEGGINFHV